MACEDDHELLGRVPVPVAPLAHPPDPLRARKARARAVLLLPDDCAHADRALALLRGLGTALTAPAVPLRAV